MPTRRAALAAGLLAPLGAASVARAVPAPPGGDGRKPCLRAAHLTDVHITDKLGAPAGVAKLFAHLFADAGGHKPELVLNTGDAVMAVDGSVGGERALVQIELWKAALRACPAPVFSCLGNHDVWGGNAPCDGAPAAKAGFGLMADALGMPAPHYSFDRAGWHFVALNSVSGWPDYGALTPAHFRWLVDDLAKLKNNAPVCVLSHLPIVSVTSNLYGKSPKRPDGVHIPKVWQHADCWELSEVFRRHPNVKLALSGHMHTADKCEYRGVTYICGGAASGAWWAGAEYGFVPQYGAIDFFADGAFDYRHTDYGWAARQWKGEQLELG